MGILDDFKRELEASKNAPEVINDDQVFAGVDKDELQAEIARQKAMIEEYDECGTICGDEVEIEESDEEPVDGTWQDDMQNIITRFNEQYPRTMEADLNVEVHEDYIPVVKRAYCPKCGKEIINQLPPMFNPYNQQKTNRYDCECGWRADLEYSYPRVCMRSPGGEEIDFFTK